MSITVLDIIRYSASVDAPLSGLAIVALMNGLNDDAIIDEDLWGNKELYNKILAYRENKCGK